MKLKRLGSAVAVTAITGLVAFGLVAPASAQTTVTANSDTASVVEDGSVSINVLGNDVPASGLTIQTVTDPPKGTASIVAGQVLYTPKADFNGTDTFAYTVTDGTSSVGAAVTVTVIPVNDAPIAKADSAKTTVGTAKSIAVLSNDKDIDSNALVVVLQSQPSHGSASLDVATQKVTYTPVAGYVGADSFTYYASDGSANSATVTVSLTVKAADAHVNAKNAKVMAACSANAADPRISGLCGVYLNMDMPPWALAQLGHVILKLDASKPAPQTDAVLAVCAEEDDDDIEWLCNIYRADNMPAGIKAIVGQRIVLLSQEDGSQNIDSDDDKKDHKQWKPGFGWQGWHGWAGWGHHDKGDKDRGDKSNSNSQAIADDSHKGHKDHEDKGHRFAEGSRFEDRDKDKGNKSQSISFGDNDGRKDHDDRDNDRQKPGRKGGHGWGHRR